jgi:hypothetical protein
VKKSEAIAWKIEHECPQCGGPVTLDETDRIFSCPYCRVRLYLLSQDYFRYYFPATKDFSKETLLVPYWRFKGAVFFCHPSGISYTINDVSSLASPHAFFPHSLGFRPQTLRMKFLSSKVEARFFRREVPLNRVIEHIEKRFNVSDGSRGSAPIYFKSFVGETISLIYSPVFIQGDRFHDAVMGKPVTPIPKEFVDDLLTFDQEDIFQVRFVSTLCPQCGWDLLGERDSVVLFCKNCDSAWEPSQQGLKRVDAGLMGGKEEKVSYLPFWRMEAAIEGLTIQSYADLLRIANAPVVAKKEWDHSSLFFWAPAFKVPPALFLRASQALTLSEPQEEFERILPKSTLSSANFSSSEAAESIKITLASVVADKPGIFPRLKEIDVQVKKYELIFLPFVAVGNEFVQSQIQFCIHKNVLQLGRNL